MIVKKILITSGASDFFDPPPLDPTGFCPFTHRIPSLKGVYAFPLKCLIHQNNLFTKKNCTQTSRHNNKFTLFTIWCVLRTQKRNFTNNNHIENVNGHNLINNNFLSK